jgi:hypothetical protein
LNPLAERTCFSQVADPAYKEWVVKYKADHALFDDDFANAWFTPGRKRYGVQGAHYLEPPGPLLTHLHAVCMSYSECLPTRLNPLAKRPCFSFPLLHLSFFYYAEGCMATYMRDHIIGHFPLAERICFFFPGSS